MAGNLIRNERVKLFAGACNAIGLAFIIGGFVAPILAGQTSLDRVLIGLLAFSAGAAVHAGAQFILGRLQE